MIELDETVSLFLINLNFDLHIVI